MPGLQDYNQFLGPLGLTCFLLFVAFGAGGVLLYAGKLILDTYGARITKIENALTECHANHEDLLTKYVALTAECGELKGRLNILDKIDPTALAVQIARLIKETP